jgi:hypothetical protein
MLCRRPRRLACACLALAALFLAAGCGRYADPGPRPARVRAAVSAEVSAGRIREAVLDRLGPPPYTPGWFHQLAPAPVWDWGLYLVESDGGLRRLQPAPGAELVSRPGAQLSAEAVFLAPPGRHRLRLLADAYLEHGFTDDSGYWREYIPLASHRRDYTLGLAPGQEASIRADFAGRP